MNKIPPLFVSGWPKEEQTVKEYKASSDSSNSKKCQSGDQERMERRERKKALMANRSLQRATLKFGDYASGGKDHILIQMYTQSEIAELTGSDHNPLPPPPAPTQGRTSQRPRWVSQFRPRTTNYTSIPSLEFTSSLFLSASFLSALVSFSLSVAFCSFVSWHSWQDCRQHEARSCPRRHLMSSTLTFFLRGGKKQTNKKKPAVSSLFSLCSLFVSLFRLVFLFCKWQQKMTCL